MKIHFLLLALLAFVALSQHNVDARLNDPAIRRMTERNLLDELLQRRMEALEEGGLGGEDNNGGFEGRRLFNYYDAGQCCWGISFNKNVLCDNVCWYGHRYSPTCGTTRACKYECKSLAVKGGCMGRKCYKHEFCASDLYPKY